MSSDTGAVALPPPDHIGIVVRDIDKTIEFLSSAWGIGPWQFAEYAPSGDELKMDEPFSIKLAFANLGSIRVELIQPLEGRSLWSEFLEKKGEGVQHIAFYVSNWDEMMSKLQEQERSVVGGGLIGGKHWHYYQSDPGGFVIQLEEPGGVELL